MRHLKTMALFCGFATLAMMLVFGGTSLFSQDKPKPEQIDAVAHGTGPQAGREFRITLIINRYSTPADRQTLMTAFQKDHEQGLVNALTKMKSVGHIAITGTLGYDVSYIRSRPTPTGRTIFFVTNRPVSFAEESHATVSSTYNLTGGTLDLNDTDKSKSTGVFYPLAKLTMDHDQEVKFDASFPFTLTDIIDWTKK